MVNGGRVDEVKRREEPNRTRCICRQIVIRLDNSNGVGLDGTIRILIECGVSSEP